MSRLLYLYPQVILIERNVEDTLHDAPLPNVKREDDEAPANLRLCIVPFKNPKWDAARAISLFSKECRWQDGDTGMELDDSVRQFEEWRSPPSVISPTVYGTVESGLCHARSTNVSCRNAWCFQSG